MHLDRGSKSLRSQMHSLESLSQKGTLALYMAELLELPLTKKIIHIDMDAFYPSVEQRDNPLLRGQPVIVGGDPQRRGVVASASYEARAFGIHSAMSSAKAHRLCPHARFVLPNFEKYIAASQKIREIFESFTHLIEPHSLDEAYLDVTSNCLKECSATEIAIAIKNQIQSKLNLTASAGVGPNKFIAKLASEFKKPNGLVVIPPRKVFAFIENLPIEKLWGVGPATAKKLHEIGITTTADIRNRSVDILEKAVGSIATFLFDLAHGRDTREVNPIQEPKSRGVETTFQQDIQNKLELLQYIEAQAQELSLELKKLNRPGRTITVKIKYADFTSITRSRTLHQPTMDARLICKIASDLLSQNTLIASRFVRLVGISVGNLVSPNTPLQLSFPFSLLD